MSTLEGKREFGDSRDFDKFEFVDKSTGRPYIFHGFSCTHDQARSIIEEAMKKWRGDHLPKIKELEGKILAQQKTQADIQMTMGYSEEASKKWNDLNVQIQINLDELVKECNKWLGQNIGVEVIESTKDGAVIFTAVYPTKNFGLMELESFERWYGRCLVKSPTSKPDPEIVMVNPKYL